MLQPMLSLSDVAQWPTAGHELVKHPKPAIEIGQQIVAAGQEGFVGLCSKGLRCGHHGVRS